MKTKIAIIGEQDPTLKVHAATLRAVKQAAEFLRVETKAVWVPTTKISNKLFVDFDGLFLAPGQPYKDGDACLRAIRDARENRFPCLGTCRGFQQMVLEFARNALGVSAAGHEEYDTGEKVLFLTKLPVSSTTVVRRRPIHIDQSSSLAPIYGKNNSIERFYGRYGVNPQVERHLEKRGFVSMASEHTGNFRVAGIPDHPFFYGTLFLPQMRSNRYSPHPLVLSLVKAAALMKIERKQNR